MTIKKYNDISSLVAGAGFEPATFRVAAQEYFQGLKTSKTNYLITTTSVKVAICQQ